MATNREIAQQIIKAYVRSRQSSDSVFLSYGQMSGLIDRPGQQRLLGAPLDLVRDICHDMGIPDIATVVVGADSMKDGTVKPAEAALTKHGGWPGLRKEQARVIAFDWATYEL